MGVVLLTLAGQYYDSTGQGPGDSISTMLWTPLLLGLVLMITGGLVAVGEALRRGKASRRVPPNY